MLFLAYKIATAAPPKDKQQTSSPFTFVQAALFQWVNPKAWAMALGAISIYAPDQSVSAFLLVAIVFSIVNLPSVSVWVMLGQKMRQVLNNQNRLRIFNFTMAGLLIASLVPVLATNLS